MKANHTILQAIAGLTAALVAQDSSTQETAEARRQLIRQAISEGYTLTAIGEASGITRNRISQLAKEGSTRDRIIRPIKGSER